jgi:DNA modification methylase
MSSEDVSPVNRLNGLTNRQWIKETKSFWRSVRDEESAWSLQDVEDLAQWLTETRGPEAAQAMLGQIISSVMWSQTPPRSKLKAQHPATFSERDIERLIGFFSKPGEQVLDPFLGSGSTLLACRACGREGTGIELIPRWAEIARQRLAETPSDSRQQVLEGDAVTELLRQPADQFDFVVTSPPYWSILTKKGMKVQAEREARDLPTQYSDSPHDLGNITDYEEFLDRLAEVFAQCGRVLRPGRYLAVIVSDFRHGPQFMLYHADLAKRIEAAGLPLRGVTVLLQDNKNLYPFGVPYSFVSNIHHQYILIHQKPNPVAPKGALHA